MGSLICIFLFKHLRRGGREAERGVSVSLALPAEALALSQLSRPLKLRETFFLALFFFNERFPSRCPSPLPSLVSVRGPPAAFFPEPCVEEDQRSCQPCVCGAAASSRFAGSRLARTSWPRQVSPVSARRPKREIASVSPTGGSWEGEKEPSRAESGA